MLVFHMLTRMLRDAENTTAFDDLFYVICKHYFFRNHFEKSLFSSACFYKTIWD